MSKERYYELLKQKFQELNELNPKFANYKCTSTQLFELPINFNTELTSVPTFIELKELSNKRYFWMKEIHNKLTKITSREAKSFFAEIEHLAVHAHIYDDLEMENECYQIYADYAGKIGAFVDSIYASYRLLQLELYSKLYSKDFNIKPFQDKLKEYSNSFNKLDSAINIGKITSENYCHKAVQVLLVHYFISHYGNFPLFRSSLQMLKIRFDQFFCSKSWLSVLSRTHLHFVMLVFRLVHNNYSIQDLDPFKIKNEDKSISQDSCVSPLYAASNLVNHCRSLIQFHHSYLNKKNNSQENKENQTQSTTSSSNVNDSLSFWYSPQCVSDLESYYLWHSTSMLVESSQLLVELYTFLGTSRESQFYQLDSMRIFQRFLLPHRIQCVFSLQAHLELFGQDPIKFQITLRNINHLYTCKTTFKQTLKSIKPIDKLRNSSLDTSDDESSFLKNVTLRNKIVSNSTDIDEDDSFIPKGLNSDEPGLKTKKWSEFASDESPYPCLDKVYSFITNSLSAGRDFDSQQIELCLRRIFFGISVVPWIEEDALFIKDTLILKRHKLLFIEKEKLSDQLIDQMQHISISSNESLLKTPKPTRVRPVAPRKKTLVDYEESQLVKSSLEEDTFKAPIPRIRKMPPRSLSVDHVQDRLITPSRSQSQTKISKMTIFCDSTQANVVINSVTPDKRSKLLRVKQVKFSQDHQDEDHFDMPVESGPISNHDLPKNVRLAMHYTREQQIAKDRSLKEESSFLLPEAPACSELFPKVLELFRRLSLLPSPNLLRPVCQWLALEAFRNNWHDRAASFFSQSVGISTSNLFLHTLYGSCEKQLKSDEEEMNILKETFYQILQLAPPAETWKLFQSPDLNNKVDSTYLSKSSNLRFLQITLVDELDVCFDACGPLSCGLPIAQGLGSRAKGLLFLTQWRFEVSKYQEQIKLVSETKHMKNFFLCDGFKLIDSFREILNTNYSILTESNREKYWVGRYNTDNKMHNVLSQMHSQWFSKEDLDWIKNWGRNSQVEADIMHVLIADRILVDLPWEWIIWHPDRKATTIPEINRSNISTYQRLKRSAEDKEYSQYFDSNLIPCVTRNVNLAVALTHLHRTLREHKFYSRTLSSQVGHPAACQIEFDASAGYYLLNPENNLAKTDAHFMQLFESFESWKGINARFPTDTEVSTAIAENDILVYLGHGNGSRFLLHAFASKTKSNVVTLLFGCSSVRARWSGRLEPYSSSFRHLMLGSPSVLGFLWDVTDADCDRFTTQLFREWLCKFESKSSKTNLLPVQMMQAIRACKMQNLVGKAAVVYGLPVSPLQNTLLPALKISNSL